MKPNNGTPERKHFHAWGAKEEDYVVKKFGFSGGEQRIDHDASFAEYDIDAFWFGQVVQYLDRARIQLHGARAFEQDEDNQKVYHHMRMAALQALAKAAFTAHDMVESAIRALGPLPEPGVSSGEIKEWKNCPPLS